MNKEEFRRKLLESTSSKEIIDLFRQEEASYFEV
jgi:hypothetical protein